MKRKKIETDNIVRISAKKKIWDYAQAILIRMQPGIYNRYNCIKIRFTRDLVVEVDKICRWFWHAGLVVKGVEMLPEGLKVDRGTYVGEAWEVTMTKCGATLFEDDADYKDWTYKIFEFKSGYK